MGIDAYPAPEFKVTHLSKEILDKFEKSPEELQEVVIAGRMMSRRIMGKASFFELQDAEGRIQVYVSRDDVSRDEACTMYNTVFKKLMDIGDIVGVKGIRVPHEYGGDFGSCERTGDIVQVLASATGCERKGW